MAHQTQSSSLHVLGYIGVALAAFGAGYFIGDNTMGTSGDAPAAVQGSAAAPSSGDVAGDSSKIPIGDSPILGDPNAPIAVVEFSDFQCPFCQRGGATVKQLQEKYPKDVKVVFKHFPLAFHKEAPAASKAAMIAGEEGKFWEMHDVLFDNFKAWKGQDMKELTAGYAKQLGLDVSAFKEKWDDPKYDQVIKRDMDLGSKLGVKGTPHFFINGERVSGAQPLNKFEEIVKKQLGEVKKLQQAGVAQDQIYAKMVDQNYADAAQPKAADRAPQAQKVHMVDVRPDDPMKGNTKDPLVTIVEFSDFQCPFCSRVNPSLDKVMENFGDKVRIVFKQNPLPFHKEAPAASKAALAAQQQGKFWEMHDLLFENHKNWKGQDMDKVLKGYAQQLGLNMGKFNEYYDSDKGDKIIKEDQALAAKVGARGTPNFFINGVQLVGAKPYNAFESEIKKQIEIAEDLKKKGKSGEELYKAAVAHNKANAPAAAAPTPKPDKPEPKVDLDKLKVGDAYTKGPDNAPVTIFEFSDFQCPYCARGANTLEDVYKQYEGKVRIVYKAFPLPFHKEAPEAHRAALAAGEQGKFWEMHDLLFSDIKALKDTSVLDKYAQELGLNMEKFKADKESDRLKKQVEDEMAEGKAVGVRGTPAFFINGTRLVGAQPLPKFKEVIDAELK